MSFIFSPSCWSLPRLPQNPTAVWPVTWDFDHFYSSEEFSFCALCLHKPQLPHGDVTAVWSPSEGSPFYWNSPSSCFPGHFRFFSSTWGRGSGCGLSLLLMAAPNLLWSSSSPASPFSFSHSLGVFRVERLFLPIYFLFSYNWAASVQYIDLIHLNVVTQLPLNCLLSCYSHQQNFEFLPKVPVIFLLLLFGWLFLVSWYIYHLLNL